MNMTTVPSDKLKEMQQEIADLKEQIKQLRIEADFNFEQYQDAGRLMFELQAVTEQQAEAIRLKDAALAELKDLMEDVYTGNYHPDSFTTQPARIALSIQPSPEILQARDERVAGACVSVIEEVIASFGKRSLVGVTKTKICLQMVI